MTIKNSLSAETTEEADSHKVLEFDGKLYPQLPGNVVKLQLQHLKAILRQYVAVVRRMYQITPLIYCFNWQQEPRISKAQQSDSLDGHIPESIPSSL